jgi:hypothetical protein
VEGYHGVIETAAADCTSIVNDFLWATLLTSEPGLRIGVFPFDDLFCTTISGFLAAGMSFPGGVVTKWGRGGATPAHEISHDLGIAHTSCDHGESEGGGCDDTYPVGDGMLDGPGLDRRSNTPVIPDDPADEDADHVHDLMSYGSPRWISRFTSHQLIDAIRVRAGDDGVAERIVPSAGGALSPRLLVAGSVGPDGAVRFTGVLNAEATDLPRPQPDGPLELRALDSMGRVIHSRRFAPHFATHSRGAGVFAFSLPNPADIATIVVVGASGELARTARSAGTPSLAVDDTAFADIGTGATRRTVRWQSADPDGDRLTFALQFSDDGGKNWRVVGLTSGAARELAIDTARLPATPAGRFRMLASDGFNTRVFDSSRTVAVPNHRPVAEIGDANAEPVRLTAGDSLDLTGGAFDPDQPAGTTSLLWSSNRDGTFGTETEATLVRPSIGRHVITLTATDDQRALGRARIVADVVPATARDRKAPRGTVASLTGAGVRLRFNEEVVGYLDGALRLETRSGKAVKTTVVGAGRDTLLKARGKIPRGALRVRIGGGLTDLGGNRLKSQLVAVRR